MPHIDQMLVQPKLINGRASSQMETFALCYNLVSKDAVKLLFPRLHQCLLVFIGVCALFSRVEGTVLWGKKATRRGSDHSQARALHALALEVIRVAYFKA